MVLNIGKTRPFRSVGYQKSKTCLPSCSITVPSEIKCENWRIPTPDSDEGRVYNRSPGFPTRARSLTSFHSFRLFHFKITMLPRQLRLPDFFASCPLKDATNPYYKEASEESRAWINSYDIFTDRNLAFFDRGSNFELLCSHVYAYAGYEQLRTTCDFVRLFVCNYLRESELILASDQYFVRHRRY